VNIPAYRFRFIAFCGFLLLAALAVTPTRWFAAQSSTDTSGEAEVRAHYTKYECRIPMRDGVKLFTAIYVPKDSAEA